MKRVTALATIISVIAVYSASATIINVPDNYPTIQQGINASSNGDTVRVAEGTYVENINFIGKNIVVGSWFLDDGDPSFISSTIIDGNQSGRVVVFLIGEDNSAVITGFTIQNGLATYGGGIFCFDSSPTISNNTISENTAHYNGGGIYNANSDPTINYNTITRNSASEGGDGIYCHNSSPVIINTIFWNDSAPNGQEIYLTGSSSPVITYCDIQGGWEGEGNIDCDPLFCDPDNGNFYLNAASCCRGAGEGGVDIGAFGIGCGQNVPTLSEWGMLIMGLLLLGIGTVAVVRRRKTTQSA